MSDLPPEVQTVDLYIGNRFYARVSREVYEEELRIAREVRPAIDQLRAWADKVLLDEAAALILGNWPPTKPAPPPAIETEEQRVRRVLAPLMRSAGTTAQVAPVPRLNQDLARLKVYTTRQFPEAPWDLTYGNVRALQELLPNGWQSMLPVVEVRHGSHQGVSHAS